MRLEGHLVPRAALGVTDRAAMYALMQRQFEDVTLTVFGQDLAAKDYAILLTDSSGAIRGFTSFALVQSPAGSAAAGEPLWALYSGDTVVDRDAWGSFALAQTWIGSVRALRRGLGGERLVWLLLCSGPRTYRFLPVFFHTFYPCFGSPTPAEAGRLADALARERYRDGFDSDDGVVRLTHPQPLRASIRALPGVADDDHVRCFYALNPGHASGDELVCLTELADDNLTRAGLRMARAGPRCRAFPDEYRPSLDASSATPGCSEVVQ